MAYNPPQYALDHLASLKVDDRAVLLEPIPKPRDMQDIEGPIYESHKGPMPEFGGAVHTFIYTKEATPPCCTYPVESHVSSGFYPPEVLSLANGIKVKVLSVKPVRCRDISLASYLDAGFRGYLYPGAWERNDWFWVAEVQVVD